MAKVLNLRDRALQSRDAVELLSDKWRIPILHLLVPGSLRSGELQRSISDISPKMFAQTLRGLERDGLVTRKIYPVVPPHVEYALTDMGHSLIEPLRDLCHWAKSHGKERNRARREFDQREQQLDRRKSAG